MSVNTIIDSSDLNQERSFDDRVEEINSLKACVAMIEGILRDYQRKVLRLQIELDTGLADTVVLTKKQYEDIKDNLDYYRGLAENTPDI